MPTRQRTAIPPPRRTLDVEEAVRLRKIEGLSASAIARRLGFRAQHVRLVLKDHGLRLRPKQLLAGEPHGPRLRSLWVSIRERCSNPRHKLYPRYGAEGYEVSPEWSDFWKFYDWAIASGYKPGLNLEVMGRSRRFCSRSCRWITVQQRMRRDGYPGGRRSERLITAFGETKSIPEWERDSRSAVSAQVLRQRLRKGIPPELAITRPPDKGDRLPKDPNRAQAVASPRRLLDWELISRLHVEEGRTPREIAERIGANAWGIRAGLKKRGVWRRRAPMLHGKPLRKVWENMLQRCENEDNASYPWYGAKGARVCSEWHDFRAFHRWGVEAGYELGMCITRRKGTNVYSPRNCRWATRQEVGLLAKHEDSSMPPRWTLLAFGERKGPTEWSRDPRCPVSLSCLLRRLRSRWRVEDAISTPPATRGRSDAPSRMLKAFNTTKGLTDWSRDRRCKVGLTGLRERLAKGIRPEAAISTPPFRLRGVVATKRATRRRQLRG